MKIVIDIPEEIYDFVQNTSFVEDERTLFKQSNAERQKTLLIFDIMDAIRNSTPLPEHHGRLIDADALEQYCFNKNFDKRLSDGGLATISLFLTFQPTIIEGSEKNDR